MAPQFEPLPPHPDHAGLERAVLARWEQERTFERVRERNRGGPKFRFMDGPITANAPAGVHHGHGRTLKDVFQRYKAVRGFDTRYQNGFDAQGLHVEVQVEKALGLNSKREIEEFGVAEFARRCREFVAHFAGVQTEQSKRLGMWMDWGNDYYTFSDTNIEYIWRFLKEVHARGWLYKGHRSTQWCPRCGTSLSKHEQAGDENYAELEHPSLTLRFPLTARKAESLAVWTTTPWTLPANVAAAVDPKAEYGLTDEGEWWAVARNPSAHFVRTVPGLDLVGLEYEGPFDHFAAPDGVVHRVIPWDEVSLSEGTGIVHIAPGCGAEDFELSREHGLPVLAPIDESGRMLPGYGELEGLSTDDVVAPVVESLRERGLLVEAGSVVHRYPVCWRCRTPLVFRVVDDWFISAQEIRQPMLDGNATVAWTPPQYKKRMDDWLRNMGDWNISRRRYFGLPLPFYPCECGHLNVLGSRAELEERAVRGLDELQELHRPWIDEVVIRCERCGGDVERIPEVGDAWLDAGIVHFSTLGWRNPVWSEHGNATGAAAGLTGADLPDHAYWEQWFPADWISEARAQIRLWFYSQCFMAITLDGRQPYRRVLTYENVVDEQGREMHKSWGNAIELDEALERMGADVMRWLACEHNPSQELRFGYSLAEDVKRRLLTLWHSVKFLVDYGNVEEFRPRLRDLEGGPDGEVRPLDRWLLARTAQLVEEATSAYERSWTPAVTEAFERFVDDLSNWYIRRSRRRFWAGDETGLRVLWYGVVQSLRVIAPVMPFLADDLWRRLVASPCEGAPDSVFLAGWPELPAAAVDGEVLEEMAEVRRVVELGRQARGEAAIRHRQPLRRATVRGAGRARRHAGEIAEELRVKEVDFDSGPVARVTLKPNLPVLGPRLGPRLPDVRRALESGEFEELGEGRVRAAGEELGPADVLRGERVAIEGWTIADDGKVSVALDTALDDDLRAEARALDLIRRLNELRKDAGLALSDRIVVTLPASQAEILDRYADWIKDEVLAVRIETDSVESPQIAKA
jgi:isoleucyl-tRNA synthetase